jgi:hypothetical protein
MTCIKFVTAALVAFLIAPGLNADAYDWTDFEVGQAAGAIVPVVQKTIVGRQTLYNGVAVTPHHLILLLPSGTSEEYLSQEGGLQLLSRYEDLNLALFHNPEADYQPITVASALGSAGRIVHLVSKSADGSLSSASGSILNMVSEKTAGNYFDLSMAKDSVGARPGSPVFNNCGQLIGIFDPSKRGEIAVAVGLEAIQEVIRGREDIDVAKGPCPSEAEKRDLIASLKEQELGAAIAAKDEELEAIVREKEEAFEQERLSQKESEEKLRATLEESELAAEEQSAQIAEKDAAIETKEQELESLALQKSEELEALEKEKQEKLDALESEKQELEQRNKNMIYGAAGFLIIFLVATILIWIRRRTSSVDQDEESADVILRGAEFTIKLHGNLLARQRGAVLGRSAAESDFVVDAPAVSRAHCKVFEREERIYVDDLGSANGTLVNGRKLSPGEPVALRSGDELQLADLALTVEFT